MAGLYLSLIPFILFIVILAFEQSKQQDDQVYVVYMGGKSTSTSGTLRDDQAKILDSVMKRSITVR